MTQFFPPNRSYQYHFAGARHFVSMLRLEAAKASYPRSHRDFVNGGLQGGTLLAAFNKVADC